MTQYQEIRHDGELAAVVLDGETTVIDPTVTGARRTIVEAMSLYAMEVAGGTQPAPYTDVAALAYARRARVTHTLAERQRSG